jgi:hypothetical protein
VSEEGMVAVMSTLLQLVCEAIRLRKHTVFKRGIDHREDPLDLYVEEWDE